VRGSIALLCTCLLSTVFLHVWNGNNTNNNNNTVVAVGIGASGGGGWNGRSGYV
jgi:hypothetical protein